MNYKWQTDLWKYVAVLCKFHKLVLTFHFSTFFRIFRVFFLINVLTFLLVLFQVCKSSLFSHTSRTYCLLSNPSSINILISRMHQSTSATHDHYFYKLLHRIQTSDTRTTFPPIDSFMKQYATNPFIEKHNNWKQKSVCDRILTSSKWHVHDKSIPPPLKHRLRLFDQKLAPV